jgi:hypothetical protein
MHGSDGKGCISLYMTESQRGTVLCVKCMFGGITWALV